MRGPCTAAKSSPGSLQPEKGRTQLQSYLYKQTNKNSPIQSAQLANIYWLSTVDQQLGAEIPSSNKMWMLPFGNLDSRTPIKDAAAAEGEIDIVQCSLSPVRSHTFLASWLKNTASRIRGS